MPDSFTITTATNTVSLDGDQRGQASFTVSNKTARTVRGRAHMATQPVTAEPWLKLVGEAERNFVGAESQQYAVQIAVPQSTQAGDYTFRLNMVDLANPDENFSEGPAVKFAVAPPKPVKKPFPWWIVAAIVGVVILLSGGFYSLSQVLSKAPVATPTAVPPTPTPAPLFGLGTWQGQFTYAGGSTPFRGILLIDTLQLGDFSGSLDEPDYNGIVKVVGQSAGKLTAFPQDAQARLQQVTNIFGNGAGIFVEFTDPSHIKGTSIILNCRYDAVVYPDGSLHGIWFPPPGTRVGGYFNLTKQDTTPKA